MQELVHLVKIGDRVLDHVRRTILQKRARERRNLISLEVACRKDGAKRD